MCLLPAECPSIPIAISGIVTLHVRMLDTGAMEHRTFTIVQDKRKTLFRIEGAPEKFETIFMLIK